MVQTLEAIKGGGGSIRVGTVGTISSLITRELESSSSASHVSSSSWHTPAPGAVSRSNGPLKPRKSMDDANFIGTSTTINKHTSPEAVWGTSGHNQLRNISVTTSATTPKRQKQKAPLEVVGNSKGTPRKSSENSSKPRSHKRSSHVPMLHSENINLENTPIRAKPLRKGTNIVDIVDVNCGNSAGSLSNRLKKLNFSKLSQSFI